MHYSDPDLGPMTLALKLDLDMVLIYQCAKKFLFHLLQKLEPEKTHRNTDATRTIPLRIHGQ